MRRKILWRKGSKGRKNLEMRGREERVYRIRGNYTYLKDYS